MVKDLGQPFGTTPRSDDELWLAGTAGRQQGKVSLMQFRRGGRSASERRTQSLISSFFSEINANVSDPVHASCNRPGVVSVGVKLGQREQGSSPPVAMMRLTPKETRFLALYHHYAADRKIVARTVAGHFVDRTHLAAGPKTLRLTTVWRIYSCVTGRRMRQHHSEPSLKSGQSPLGRGVVHLAGEG